MYEELKNSKTFDKLIDSFKNKSMGDSENIKACKENLITAESGLNSCLNILIEEMDKDPEERDMEMLYAGIPDIARWAKRVRDINSQIDLFKEN